MVHRILFSLILIAGLPNCVSTVDLSGASERNVCMLATKLYPIHGRWDWHKGSASKESVAAVLEAESRGLSLGQCLSIRKAKGYNADPAEKTTPGYAYCKGKSGNVFSVGSLTSVDVTCPENSIQISPQLYQDLHIERQRQLLR